MYASIHLDSALLYQCGEDEDDLDESMSEEELEVQDEAIEEYNNRH